MRLMQFWWQVQWRTLQRDSQARLTAGVLLALSLGMGLWSATSLSAQVAQWGQAGTELLTGRLWLLCLLAWVSVASVGLLGTVKKAFGDEETLLLHTLPLPPAARFRALYAWLLGDHLCNLLLIATLSIGVGLGRIALPWLFLFLAGSALVALLVLLGLFLVVGALLPRGWRGVAWVLVGVLGLVGGASGLWGAGLLPSTWPAPEVAGAALLLTVGLLVGPLGSLLGRQYETAFQVAQGWDRRQRVHTLPGLDRLIVYLSRHRTPDSALLVKELLQRSRSRFHLPRLAVLPLYLLLFGWLYPLAAARGLPDSGIVVAYTVALVMLGGIIDSNPSPIGSEGNRLTLLLVAPLSLTDILRMKLTSFLWSLLALGVLVGLLLGLWVGLPLLVLAQSLVAIALMLLGLAALFAWGSAWDEDLDLSVTGEAQMFIQEEVPVTVVRIALIQLGFSLLGLMLAVVWQLPLLLALPALALVDGIVLALAWHVARAKLQWLVRAG
ncbi:MAG: hypothetical protein H0T73_08140 [Ardenticatenales bacterium]|nr:hypothetical protein [Ardenticatenales bacterium]